MIIGKDRTNMPVTSSEQLDEELADFEERITDLEDEEHTTLYDHYFTVYDSDENPNYLHIITATKDPYFTYDVQLTILLQHILADTNKVGMFIEYDGDGTYHPLLNMEDGQSHETIITYIASGSLANDTYDDTYNSEVKDAVRKL